MILAVLAMVSFLGAPAFAGDVVVQMNLIDESGVGKPIGTVTLVDGKHGLELKPALAGLMPGTHGFHVHEKPSCAAGTKDGKSVPGLGAGAHYDPTATAKHEGPYRDGHLGDLPVLIVGNDGKAELPVLAPRLKLADVQGRALMIHAGGDNYADLPEKLGGGGARIACGAVGP
jgi:Cu-Zn family superoxide dismutase